MRVENKDIGREIIKSIELGYPTNQYIRYVMKITKGISNNNQWRWNDWREDAESEVYVRFMKYWDKINPNKNPHSYIYSLVFTTFDNFSKKEQRYTKKINRYNDLRGKLMYDIVKINGKETIQRKVI